MHTALKMPDYTEMLIAPVPIAKFGTVVYNLILELTLTTIKKHVA